MFQEIFDCEIFPPEGGSIDFPQTSGKLKSIRSDQANLGWAISPRVAFLRLHCLPTDDLVNMMVDKFRLA
jgi:hypothetical protein